jgi:hypothetical protein
MGQRAIIGAHQSLWTLDVHGIEINYWTGQQKAEAALRAAEATLHAAQSLQVAVKQTAVHIKMKTKMKVKMKVLLLKVKLLMLQKQMTLCQGYQRILSLVTVPHQLIWVTTMQACLM